MKEWQPLHMENYKIFQNRAFRTEQKQIAHGQAVAYRGCEAGRNLAV